MSAGVERVLWQSHESQPRASARALARSLGWAGPRPLARHSGTAGRIWLNVTHHAGREGNTRRRAQGEELCLSDKHPFPLPAINLHHSNLQTFPLVYFQTLLFTLWKSFQAIQGFLIFTLLGPSSLFFFYSFSLFLTLSLLSCLLSI